MSRIQGLTPESLDEYFAAKTPTQHVLCEHPRVILRIDPSYERLELRTPSDETAPDLSGLRHVTHDVVDLEDGSWSVVRTSARDMRFEAYGLMLAVAESMRGGSSFAAAVNAAMTNLRLLLAARARLSESQQLGLLGELLVLETLADEHGGQDALDWWLGPDAEQHDFALGDVDLEIKTTLSERRSHRISGVDQLRRNPGRPLWLVSIQLTRAGGADGPSLTRQVAQLRKRYAGVERFVSALTELGWRDEDADLYDARYLLRSTPRAYPVDDDFPALTAERLRTSVPHAELVSEVSYRIDVTDRPYGTPTGALETFLTREGDLA